ncbi:MAG: DUF4268 domain-containing protein [Planctomycetota bacterium]|nr:DUF4268 domain-containing protein [Planctomycetota bacterium]
MEKQSLGRLAPVELRTVWADEAREFTPWLAENLDRLSEVLDMDFELDGVEVAVGPYKADIVANDANSNAKVIIENQFGKTDHDHLGKIITYASGLGASAIVWIAEAFTEEHRQAIDFLNTNASPGLRLFALEIGVYKIGDSAPAEQFKIISKPNEYSVAVKSKSRGETETQALYLEFWSAFKEYCRSTGSSLKLRKPRPQQWTAMAVGRSKFHLSLAASSMHKRISCEIYIRGANAKRAFELLERSRGQIEKETGTLDWDKLPDGQDCRIALRRHEVNVSDRSVWNSAFEWLRKNAEVFHRVFSPLVKALPIADDEAEAREVDEGDK